MAGTRRLSALRLGLVQESREQEREGGAAGGRGLCFDPVRWSAWGHFEHRRGSLLLLHTGRTEVEGPVGGAVVTRGRDEMGPEQRGSCGGEGRGSTQESRVRITARMGRGVEISEGGNFLFSVLSHFCAFFFPILKLGTMNLNCFPGMFHYIQRPKGLA